MNQTCVIRIAYFATIARNLIVINFYLDQTISTKYPMDYIEFINVSLLGIRVHSGTPRMQFSWCTTELKFNQQKRDSVYLVGRKFWNWKFRDLLNLILFFNFGRRCLIICFHGLLKMVENSKGRILTNNINVLNWI